MGTEEERDRSLRTRRSDHPWKKRLRIVIRENWYRDVWLLLITGICALGVFTLSQTITQQTNGRKFAVGVTCAAISAIGEAGRDVLLAQAKGPETRFDKNLERLGYPPLSVRRRSAEAAARTYVGRISAAVQEQVGGRGAQLVRPDGTFDCARLQRLAKTKSK